MRSKKGGANTSEVNPNTNFVILPKPPENTVDKIVDIFITYLDEYNKNVDIENAKLIEKIKEEKQAKLKKEGIYKRGYKR